MDYKDKYSKYKNKYLELKRNVKQLGGARQNNTKVRTIGNGGSLEGMTYQCFWISVLEYLRRHGYPRLTLKELRTQAGLGQDTENMMFDTDYNARDENGFAIPVFLNAAERIAQIYNLRIQIYTVNAKGVITGARGLIGNGRNLVEIAQFGLLHFELIDNNGSDFVPAVVIKGEIKKDIPSDIKNIYIQLSENQGFLGILNEQVKHNVSAWKDQYLQVQRNINLSNEFTPEQKTEFLKQSENFAKTLSSEITAEKQKINELKEENSTLALLISEYESK